MFQRVIFGAVVCLGLQSEALACRVPIRADVVVYGKLVGPSGNCRECGPRIKAYKVIRGPKQSYFQIDPNEIEITCYGRAKKLGSEGVFGLLGEGPGFSQLYFSDTKPTSNRDTYQ